MDKNATDRTIYTIGHSTRSLDDLVHCLKAQGIRLLIDVRAIPYSRYNPQFNREDLIEQMPGKGIGYVHLGSLGGRRPSKEVMEKARSCSDRSKGFSSYMKTDDFKQGIAQVEGFCQGGEVVAMMCGEIDPHHCHRFWIAEELQERGWELVHILNENETIAHPRTLFSSLEE